jgi:hypothetical protein
MQLFPTSNIVNNTLKGVQGIPFRTIITGPPPQAPHQPRPFYFGLGYCQQNYKPTAVDYAAYERARDDFLRGPRGRAALMKGGIVWRLAMQSLHQDVVIAGPSKSVYQSGICFVEEGSGRHWWDDNLTVDEMNLICGVYKVFTGNSVFRSSCTNCKKPQLDRTATGKKTEPPVAVCAIFGTTGYRFCQLGQHKKTG